ncbi:ankyrin repeat domain-containing protein [Rickettsia endosymbiont of Seladonia tumulorum]
MFTQLIEAINKYYNPLNKIEEIENLISQMSAAELDKVDGNKCTALHLAVIRGQEKNCELLISKMSDEAINAVDKDGYTALHLAVIRG